MGKIQTPVFLEPDLLAADIAYLKECRAKEERIQGRRFRDLVCEEEDFSHMVFSGVSFENCKFWNLSFQRAEFTDVVFSSCDISGSDFDSSYFKRTEFHFCKGMGLKLTGGILKNVSVNECNWTYVNLDASRLENTEFKRTKLDSGNITQCRCRQVSWREASLINASFFKTPLCGMDFSDSMIAGLVLSDDNAELKGAIVDVYQAVELSKRLGLVIKEE